jgi:hypothetical protein
LQSQRVSQGAVVTVRPYLPGTLRIDQLHVDGLPDPLPVAHCPRGRFATAKGFADSAQVLRCGIAKLHHRRTTDDPQVFDLCQACKVIVVLNTVCEKCVVLSGLSFGKARPRWFSPTLATLPLLAGVKPNAQRPVAGD